MSRRQSSLTEIKWSPTFSYAVGLITSDGNLSPNGRSFEFSSKDFENVENLKQCLGLETKITLKKRGSLPYTHCYHTQFGNIKLYQYLQGLGLGPRKSLRLKAVSIPVALFADFLRGLWDGDGGFSTFSHPESRRLQWKARISSGSFEFVDWLRKTIQNYYGIVSKIYRTRTVYQLVFHQNEGRRLLGIMYYDPAVICLSRKAKQAEFLKGDRFMPAGNYISEGHVAELEDAQDLGSCPERGGGSTPSMPKIMIGI